jgi:hypothetical protein
MGALYNPSNSNIQLPNLAPIKEALASSIQILNEKKPLYKNAVASRETAMTPLGKTVTSVLNAFKSIQITPADRDNIASIVKKIRGDKKPTKPNPDTAASEAISTSQMSFDSRIANFSVLINTLNTQVAYNPNEENLKTSTLLNYQQNLAVLNSQVNATGNALITARINRDALLYDNAINVMQLVKDIKAYLKSLGTAGEAYYKVAVKLKFTDK